MYDNLSKPLAFLLASQFTKLVQHYLFHEIQSYTGLLMARLSGITEGHAVKAAIIP